MTTSSLHPWTEIVKLHPDVESGSFTEAMFAIDLGAIASGDANIPVVNRDAESFFRATYLTTDLRKLLDEVLASLAGKAGYNRVLKLRTPFGGGKSHTLAALLHAARSRKSLDLTAEGKRFPNPGQVAVAVFDGEKFDARVGKTVEDGRQIQTIWGWLAWQISPDKAFSLVAEHDHDRVAPGGDIIQEMLTRGAENRPVLILLDELLKYMERASAVAVMDSTLQRQAKDFFQNLTVEVANSKKCALVYSLTWSAREALGNLGLLSEIDHLSTRVDQLREPVSGDEILPILKRRLLADYPDEESVTEAALAYENVFAGMKRAYATTDSTKRRADEEGIHLRERIRMAYPFHPALIDIMRERWSSIASFQRTRGALRFLASCLYALKRGNNVRFLLGPGDIPLADPDVRVKMLKELGAQNDYDAVITADIEGPNARARQIDTKLAAETPALLHVKPAARLATAILLYSFGGLRREGHGEEETLPAGVTESELLATCVGPELDNITATAVLAQLRSSCLYLHYDGVRYCFKKEPNVTKLIEDAEQEVAREEAQASGQEPVQTKIKQMLEHRLAGHTSVYVWPGKSQEIPDKEPEFLLAYLTLDFANEAKAEQESRAQEFLTKYGERPRIYRNGLGLVIPDRKEIEPLKRAVRYLLAIERVEAQKKVHRLSKEQLEQLKERRSTEEAAAESASRELYYAVWLLRVEDSKVSLEKVERGGRPLQATGIHERIMELLTSTGSPKIHATVTPDKVRDRVKLGESLAPGQPIRIFAKLSDVVAAFFASPMPPRLQSTLALKKAIVRGVAEGKFAYTSGTLKSQPDGSCQFQENQVVLKKTLAEDEIDFESGAIMMPDLVKEHAQESRSEGETITKEPDAGKGAEKVKKSEGTESKKQRREIHIRFKATRTQIFKAFPAIANLADKSDDGKVTIEIEGISKNGYDPSWLRNALEEPLDEADVERE